MFTRQVKVQVGKSTYITNTSKSECRLWWEINNFPSISSLIGRVLSIFRQKMEGPNPSELDIKVFNPAPTFYSQAK